MQEKADEFVVVEKPKRAPTKRVAKSVSKSKIEKPKSVRRTPVKSSESKIEARKAPTTLAEIKSNRKSSKKPQLIVIILLLLGLGSSAMIGLTDKGQIDVTSLIEERNKKAEERGEKVVSTSVKDQLPDGGLIPADPSTIATTTQPTSASSTASTTPVGNIPRTDEEVESEAATASST